MISLFVKSLFTFVSLFIYFFSLVFIICIFIFWSSLRVSDHLFQQHNIFPVLIIYLIRCFLSCYSISQKQVFSFHMCTSSPVYKRYHNFYSTPKRFQGNIFFPYEYF